VLTGSKCKFICTTVCAHAYVAQQPIWCCMQTSLGGLRQELHAVKQLKSSRSGSSPRQQLSGPGFHGPGELLDPLHGFHVRLSTATRRSEMACGEASGDRLVYDPPTVMLQLRHAVWQQFTVWCRLLAGLPMPVGQHGNSSTLGYRCGSQRC
jgi:hypothetical protein